MTTVSAIADVADLADEVLAAQASFEPLNATMLGIPGYDHGLADVSAEAHDRLRQRAVRLAGRADVLMTSAQGEDAITAAVAAQQARALVDLIDARTIEFSVTDYNYVGPAAMVLSRMPVVALDDAQRSAAYLERLRAIPDYLVAVAQRHRAGVAAGRTPVRTLVDSAIAHVDRYLADPAGDPLRHPVPAASAAAFVEARDALLRREVRPAFARYRDVLATEIHGHGRSDDKPGLVWLPDGDAAYAALVRVHTTTGHTVDDLHGTGLDLIEALRGEYAQVGERAFGTGSQQEIFQQLGSLKWKDAAELLGSARAAIARAEAAAPQWFGVLPRLRCGVRAVPATEAPGAPLAYYFQPPLDGSRQGVYYANTHRAEERARFVSEVTAFHEAVPGHHLQLTLAIEREGLPPLRRLADVNAAIEGWALYAERLADEMGLYSSDVARLGMLAMDSMRAGRLVVDTGLHAKGWSRERAIAFLREHTPLSALEVASEVDRYIAYPGQALSYMVGRLEIQRLRRDAERALGAGFDIRRFHDLILRAGPLPLDVLDRVVGSWCAAERPHSAAGDDSL